MRLIRRNNNNKKQYKEQGVKGDIGKKIRILKY